MPYNPLVKIIFKVTLWEKFFGLSPQNGKEDHYIEEAKDLSNYSLENLIGNLTSYEVQLKEKEKEKEEKDTFKKKNIALKITSDSDYANDDEDIALLTRKF